MSNHLHQILSAKNEDLSDAHFRNELQTHNNNPNVLILLTGERLKKTGEACALADEHAFDDHIPFWGKAHVYP